MKKTLYYAQTLSDFFSVKTLRTIHEFCMVNLPYHNEYVKILRKFSLWSWVTEATTIHETLPLYTTTESTVHGTTSKQHT